MATGTLTNNRHTPYHSSNVLKSNTKLRASDVRPQNTPDIRPTPDQIVDQILTKARPPLAGGEVLEVVEELEKVSRKHLQTADWHI